MSPTSSTVLRDRVRASVAAARHVGPVLRVGVRDRVREQHHAQVGAAGVAASQAFTHVKRGGSPSTARRRGSARRRRPRPSFPPKRISGYRAPRRKVNILRAWGRSSRSGSRGGSEVESSIRKRMTGRAGGGEGRLRPAARGPLEREKRAGRGAWPTREPHPGAPPPAPPLAARRNNRLDGKPGILGLSLPRQSTLFQLLTRTPAAAPAAAGKRAWEQWPASRTRRRRLGEMFRRRNRSLAPLSSKRVRPRRREGQGGRRGPAGDARAGRSRARRPRLRLGPRAPTPTAWFHPARREDAGVEPSSPTWKPSQRRLERLEATINKGAEPTTRPSARRSWRLKETLETQRLLRRRGSTDEEVDRRRGHASGSAKPMLLGGEPRGSRDAPRCGAPASARASAASRASRAWRCRGPRPSRPRRADLSPRMRRLLRDELSARRAGPRAAPSSRPMAFWSTSFLTAGEERVAAPGRIAAGRARRPLAHASTPTSKRGSSVPEADPLGSSWPLLHIAACRERAAAAARRPPTTEVKDGDADRALRTTSEARHMAKRPLVPVPRRSPARRASTAAWGCRPGA